MKIEKRIKKWEMKGMNEKEWKRKERMKIEKELKNKRWKGWMKKNKRGKKEWK